MQALAAVTSQPAVLGLSRENIKRKCAILRANLPAWDGLTLADMSPPSIGTVLLSSDAVLFRLEYVKAKTGLSPSTLIVTSAATFELRFSGYLAWLCRTHGIELKACASRVISHCA